MLQLLALGSSRHPIRASSVVVRILCQPRTLDFSLAYAPRSLLQQASSAYGRMSHTCSPPFSPGSLLQSIGSCLGSGIVGLQVGCLL